MTLAKGHLWFDQSPFLKPHCFMRFILRCVLLLTLLWMETVWAGNCASNSYTLASQAQVNDLADTGCDTIRGNLSIDSGANLTNVDGLAKLISVEGHLLIQNNIALTNVDDLANLAYVGGDLTIYANSALRSIDGLANLTKVGGDLDIDSNDALADLDGFANLTSVGGYLAIESNAALINCQGVAPVLGWPDGPPDDNVVGVITIYDNKTGCDSIVEALASGPVESPSYLGLPIWLLYQATQ